MQSIDIVSIEIVSRNLTVVLRSTDEGEQLVEFTMPDGYQLNRDLVMIALTTLIGTKYGEIRTHFGISEGCRQAVSRLCQAEVQSLLEIAPLDAVRGDKRALNFSGGFDSMAALALLPEDIELISLDFGGAFAREREFFETFPTTIIQTNFRQLGLALNSWSFMGIGPILLRDHLRLGSYGFGTILEATPYNFIELLNFSNVPNPWFAAAGLKQFNPALGLTEVGTAMLLLTHFPQHVDASLASLAAPTSEKRYRKALMLHLAGRITSNSFELPSPTQEEPYLPFGRSLPTDFLALYVLKHLGPEIAERLAGGIPQAVYDVIGGLRMTFFERLNTNFYNNVEGQSRALVVARCAEAGIALYDEMDWREFGMVRSLLAQYHSIPEAG